MSTHICSPLLEIARKSSNLLPHGAWTLNDGTVVLFSRGHRALFEYRRGVVRTVPYDEQRARRVGIVRHATFWCSPRQNQAMRERCLLCVLDWTFRAIDGTDCWPKAPYMPEPLHEF